VVETCDARIPDYITKLISGAFSYKGISQISIPDAVEEIGYGTFSGCSQLASVTFENPNGWYVSTLSGDDEDYGELTAISADKLAATATAAKYLTQDYVGYFWHNLAKSSLHAPAKRAEKFFCENFDTPHKISCNLFLRLLKCNSDRKNWRATLKKYKWLRLGAKIVRTQTSLVGG